MAASVSLVVTDLDGTLWHTADRVPAEVEARRAAAVEHVDLRGVADPEQGAVERDGVAHREVAHLRLGHRRRELVVRHQ
jgi:FMN phosphatase YigB (HAD superfamily)